MTMKWTEIATIAAGAFIVTVPWSVQAQLSSSGKTEQKSGLSDMARTPGVPTWGTGPGSAASPSSSFGGLSELPAYGKRPGYGGPTTDLRSDSTSSGLGSTSGAGGGSTGAGVGRDDGKYQSTLGSSIYQP
jgi:hypothetical protein